MHGVRHRIELVGLEARVQLLERHEAQVCQEWQQVGLLG